MFGNPGKKSHSRLETLIRDTRQAGGKENIAAGSDARWRRKEKGNKEGGGDDGRVSFLRQAFSELHVWSREKKKSSVLRLEAPTRGTPQAGGK